MKRSTGCYRLLLNTCTSSYWDGTAEARYGHTAQVSSEGVFCLNK